MGARFSRLFHRAQANKAGGGPISEHDRAILDLKVARDRLKRYQKVLDKDAATLVKQAQALVLEGRKDRAGSADPAENQKSTNFSSRTEQMHS